jgi:hypothetical protein
MLSGKIIFKKREKTSSYEVKNVFLEGEFYPESCF